MRQTILAKRYAKALMAVGKEDGKHEAYSEMLAGIKGLIAEQPVIMDGLTNPLYPMELREKVMGQLITSLDCDQNMANFLNLLVQKRRAAILPEIADALQILVDADKNVSRGQVVSVMELSAELLKKVQATLEKIIGNKVILTTKIDPSIIGGIVAKVGDLVLDGSIKTQLAGLNESIQGSE